ncbi:MAG: methylmalonyl Co-A mutase-associated GTPase MeaB [Pirellulales bacterium]|nr:methylmalonyl Co-A mutase-associated GTPase MeaB [Pirellulales bacterium]
MPSPSLPGGARRREMTVADYVQGVRAGSIGALARTLTLVESSLPEHRVLAQQVLAELLPATGGSVRVGISGVPGVGKSTFIDVLGQHLVAANRRVAVLAVDPSSTVTGGSILGDKTRMGALSAATAAYIRPSPSAGTLGGVARKTRESLLVCEAAGFDVVLVETVGVGQSETMVAEMTDCFLALMLPTAGDELQAIKRGLLELVDVIAVNKADGPMKPAAEVAARQYRGAVESISGRPRNDQPAVLTCSAREGQRIGDVWEAVQSCVSRRRASGELDQRRQRQNLHWLRGIVSERLHSAFEDHPRVKALRQELEAQVVAGVLPAEIAADRLLAAFGATAGG